MTDVRRSDPREGAPPDLEDVLTGVLEEMLRLNEGPNHMVLEWVVMARMIDPDGKSGAYIVWRRGTDEVIARGLADKLADEVNDWTDGDED